MLLLNQFGLALPGRFTKPRTRGHAPLTPCFCSGPDAKLGRDRVRRVSTRDRLLGAVRRHLAGDGRLHPRLGLRLLPAAAPEGGRGERAQTDAGPAGRPVGQSENILSTTNLIQ